MFFVQQTRLEIVLRSIDSPSNVSGGFTVVNVETRSLTESSGLAVFLPATPPSHPPPLMTVRLHTSHVKVII